MSVAKAKENPYADLTRDGLSTKGTYVRLAKRLRPLQDMVLKPVLYRLNEETVRVFFKLSAFYPEGLAMARANRPYEGIGEKLEKWFEDSELVAWKHSNVRVGTEFHFDVKAGPGDEKEFKEALSTTILDKVFLTVSLSGIELDEARRAKKAVLRRLVDQFDEVFTEDGTKLKKREIGKVVAEFARLKEPATADADDDEDDNFED